MLEIEIRSREVGSGYLVVNGIVDLSSKVENSSIGQKPSALRIRKKEVINVLINSAFEEIGNFLSNFAFRYSKIEHWDGTNYVRVFCAGDNELKGCVEVELYRSSQEWRKSYSINDLRSVISVLCDKLEDVVLLPHFREKAGSLQFKLRFYTKEIGKISAVVNDLIQTVEWMLDKAQSRFNRKHFGFSFNVAKGMTIALKQYLIYFQEYVEIAKGKKIIFEVSTTEEGIFIETGVEDDLIKLNNYFNEYLGFVKSNIEDLQPNFEVPITEVKKEMFVMGLKQQVHHLKQQIELKNFEIKVLERQVADYYNLLSIHGSRPLPPIHINTTTTSTSKSNSASYSYSKADVVFNLKQELPALQTEVLELKTHLGAEVPDVVKKEVEQIDVELLYFEVDNLEKIDKKPFRRIKRLFDQLTKEDSSFNKTVQQSKKLKEALQKVGKSYNKIAEWLAMPVIPNVLLNI